MRRSHHPAAPFQTSPLRVTHRICTTDHRWCGQLPTPLGPVKAPAFFKREKRVIALIHALPYSYSNLALKLLPNLIVLGFMLAVSSYILYKSPLKHYRPGIVFLMLGAVSLTLGLAVIFSHTLPYRLSRWLLLPGGIIFVCAALLMMVGVHQTSEGSKAAKQVAKPSVEEESTTWPPPPKHSAE